MRLTITLYSTVFVTGNVDKTRAQCEAYLYRPTTIAENGQYDMLDSNGRNTTFVLETSMSCDVIGFDEAEEQLGKLSREAERTRRYQLDRFSSGLYATHEFHTWEEACEYALETTLS